jgi:hypothetical protein
MGFQSSSTWESGGNILEMSCLLLVAVGPVAFGIWVGLKLWGGPDAHLRFNMVTSTVLGGLGVLVLLAYFMARVYPVVVLFVVVPHMDPRVFIEPD